MKSLSHMGLVKSILALGVPLIVGELGSITQQFADTMMVGHHSTDELAAAGFVNSLFLFVIFLSLGMSYACTPVVGNAFGKKDYNGLIRILYETIIVNLLVGVFFVIALTGVYFAIEWFHQPPEILVYARPYLLIIMSSVPFLTLFYGLKQFMDGLGKTSVSMWVLLFSNIVNIFLNWCLIFGHCGFPELGLTGAGLSTLVSRVIQTLLVAWAVHRTKKAILSTAEEDVQLRRPTASGVLYQVKLGIPISIQLGLEISIFNVCGIFMGWLGVDPLAAHQAMYTISTLCFQVLYGIAAAGSILVSQMVGAGQIKDVRRTSATTFFVGLTLDTIIISLICIFFDPLCSCFTNDPNVKDVMRLILPWFVLYQLGDCTQITFANALRGIEKTRPLMMIAAFAYIVVSIPLSYLFAFVLGMGSSGVWLGVPFGLSTAGILFFITFRRSLPALERLQVPSGCDMN